MAGGPWANRAEIARRRAAARRQRIAALRRDQEIVDARLRAQRQAEFAEEMARITAIYYAIRYSNTPGRLAMPKRRLRNPYKPRRR